MGSRVVWIRQNGHLDLFSCDSFQTTWDKKAVCWELGLDFLSLWPDWFFTSLGNILTPPHICLFCGKPENNNDLWTLGLKFTHKPKKKLNSHALQGYGLWQATIISIKLQHCHLTDIRPVTRRCNTCALRHKCTALYHKKWMLTFPLRPTVHAKVDVTGLLTTLWSRWITVDVQNEYIYSYMRTAIITSVCLEDKADFMWLCLGNTWNLLQDERKPYFLIQFRLESTAAGILFVAQWIQKESK